jgi:hypothetical protein
MTKDIFDDIFQKHFAPNKTTDLTPGTKDHYVHHMHEAFHLWHRYYTLNDENARDEHYKHMKIVQTHYLRKPIKHGDYGDAFNDVWDLGDKYHIGRDNADEDGFKKEAGEAYEHYYGTP